VTKRRQEGRARKKSTSEDYGNDIHFFSLSASCFSRALRTFFLSSPPSPCFSCDSPTILRPLPIRSCENVGIYKVEHSRSRPDSFGMVECNGKTPSSSSESLREIHKRSLRRKHHFREISLVKIGA